MPSSSDSRKAGKPHLKDLGAPIRSIAQKPGSNALSLRGSAKLPAKPAQQPEARRVAPKITICPPFVDERFAPDPQAIPFFNGTWPGIDPETKRPWGVR